jgi:hypothetical protein
MPAPKYPVPFGDQSASTGVRASQIDPCTIAIMFFVGGKLSYFDAADAVDLTFVITPGSPYAPVPAVAQYGIDKSVDPTAIIVRFDLPLIPGVNYTVAVIGELTGYESPDHEGIVTVPLDGPLDIILP